VKCCKYTAWVLQCCAQLTITSLIVTVTLHIRIHFLPVCAPISRKAYTQRAMPYSCIPHHPPHKPCYCRLVLRLRCHFPKLGSELTFIGTVSGLPFRFLSSEVVITSSIVHLSNRLTAEKKILRRNPPARKLACGYTFNFIDDRKKPIATLNSFEFQWGRTLASFPPHFQARNSSVTITEPGTYVSIVI
jgi:hypothetical protein